MSAGTKKPGRCPRSWHTHPGRVESKRLGSYNHSSYYYSSCLFIILIIIIIIIKGVGGPALGKFEFDIRNGLRSGPVRSGAKGRTKSGLEKPKGFCTSCARLSGVVEISDPV